jgi:hypothetical protein
MKEFISEKDILIKAYLRRGLSYERSEKIFNARRDFISVKEIDPLNV